MHTLETHSKNLRESMPPYFEIWEKENPHFQSKIQAVFKHFQGRQTTDFQTLEAFYHHI